MSMLDQVRLIFKKVLAYQETAVRPPLPSPFPPPPDSLSASPTRNLSATTPSAKPAAKKPLATSLASVLPPSPPHSFPLAG